MNELTCTNSAPSTNGHGAIKYVKRRVPRQIAESNCRWADRENALDDPEEECAYLTHVLTRVHDEDHRAEILARLEELEGLADLNSQEHRLRRLRLKGRSGRWSSPTIDEQEPPERLDGQRFLIGRMTPNNFHQMPKWLAAIPQGELSYGAKMVFAYLYTLAAHDGHSQGGNVILPRRDRIATAIGAAPRTVSRYVQELCKFGLLEIEMRRARSNIYRLKVPNF